MLEKIFLNATNLIIHKSNVNSTSTVIRNCCNTRTSAETKKITQIGKHSYSIDEWTNVTPKILSFLDKNKHLQKHHPLSIIRKRIVNYFYGAYRNARGNPLFSVYDRLNPIVTVEQNFDNLLIAADHPSRAKSDCYYINKNYLLRAHTTAHQVESIKSGLDNFLIVGEVFRRDEIDSTHYPVFHQLDAVRLMHSEQIFRNNSDLEIFETSYKIKPSSFSPENLNSKCIDHSKQPCHTMEAVKLTEHELKTVLVGLVKDLFGNKIEYRWVDTYFPFTQPSWELEIFYKNNWLEVLGCGVMRDEILKSSGVENCIGYAFGLGLERLAMILFDIPDIRLFWSNDSGFLNQFSEINLNVFRKYKPISIFPQCTNDLSFWLPNGTDVFCLNDFYDLVRNIGGDVIEQISIVDKFKSPKTGKTSFCFRIIYRHMEKTLTQREVSDIHNKIAKACEQNFNVQIR